MRDLRLDLTARSRSHFLRTRLTEMIHIPYTSPTERGVFNGFGMFTELCYQSIPRPILEHIHHMAGTPRALWLSFPRLPWSGSKEPLASSLSLYSSLFYTSHLNEII